MNHSTRAGFTLIEMMAVVAVIAILATLALPGIRARLVRDQIVEAMKIAEIAKAPIAAAWATGRAVPADNAAAGLPPPGKIVGSFVSAVAIEAGAIQVTFGNKVNPLIAGKTLSLRPAVVEGAPIVPIAWICGHAAPVDKMVVLGTDRTDVEPSLLPINCKAGG
jgi:type IV pilus assembly protein PilA